MCVASSGSNASLVRVPSMKPSVSSPSSLFVVPCWLRRTEHAWPLAPFLGGYRFRFPTFLERRSSSRFQLAASLAGRRLALAMAGDDLLSVSA
jgi:hypothetical protein